MGQQKPLHSPPRGSWSLELILELSGRGITLVTSLFPAPFLRPLLPYSFPILPGYAGWLLELFFWLVVSLQGQCPTL